MKTIGMIGGVSWQATIEYYRIINETIGKILGGHHSANIIMTCRDFDPLVKLAHEENWEELKDILIKEVKKLEDAGADFFIICANTKHKLADDIVEAVNIPILHIVDATAEEIIKRDLNKVGLLGTRFTMEDGFYQNRLKKYEIEAIIPNMSDRLEVHRIIYDELVHGIINEESRNKYLEIINSLIKEGAQGIILGCTEIPLLIRQEIVSVPVFDTTRIHAEAAARMAA